MSLSMGMEKALEELVDSKLWAEHNTCPSTGRNGMNQGDKQTVRRPGLLCSWDSAEMGVSRCVGQ